MDFHASGVNSRSCAFQQSLYEKKYCDPDNYRAENIPKPHGKNRPSFSNPVDFYTVHTNAMYGKQKTGNNT